MIVPIANHDNNQHGPGENLRVGNLWHGIDLMAALLGEEFADEERRPHGPPLNCLSRRRSDAGHPLPEGP